MEVTLKELELKRLLIDSNRGVSQALPAQKKWLNESMLVITDGYFSAFPWQIDSGEFLTADS